MGWIECLRRLCCLKKVKIDELSEDDEDFIPARYAEPLNESSPKGHSSEEPASFFRSSVLSIYKNVDSAYKKASEWSLPKNTHVNLFTLSEEDITGYEDNGFFDDVVDEKF